jgi:hypothetical protein
MEAYYVLGRYLERNRPPAAVVLSLSPYHFQESLFWERLTRYHFLRPEEQLEASLTLRGAPGPALVDESTKALASTSLLDALGCSVWLPFCYSASLIEGRVFKRRAENLRTIDEVVAARGYKQFGKAASNDESNLISKAPATFHVAGVLDLYMDRLLELARAHGIAVSFYAMPFNETSWRIANQQRARYIAGYHAHLERLARKAPHVKLLNRLHVLPNDHFGDSSHVNDRGLAVVCADLEQRLGKLAQPAVAAPMR